MSKLMRGRVRPRRLDHSLDQVSGVERLGLEVEPADLELVREQDLVHDAGEAVGLVDDQRDEAFTSRVVEGEVVATQRLRRP